MDIYLETFDAMYDMNVITFLNEWLYPVVGSIVAGWIVIKLKAMDKKGQKRENVALITEFKIESIAHALSNAPQIGDHFKTEYEKKFNSLMKQEEFINSNGKT